jgi:isopenicillin-N epimerase
VSRAATTVRDLPPPGPLARDFRLDPGTVYLNHGSFGACPTPVLEAQARWRDRVEADAVRFYVDDLWPLMDRSRRALAPVVGTDASNLAFVANATTGVTTALHNLRLREGDEILTDAAEYTACLNNCRAAAARAGARVVSVNLPWPMPGPDAVVEAFAAGMSARTRVAMFSLVTSSTGMRLPVERLIGLCRERGVDSILDAAHGPGCVPVSLDHWGPTFATGNCHKWLCNPKGAAFLYVTPDRQPAFRPLVLSNDAERLEPAATKSGRSAFLHEFDYAGTDDATAKLTVADSVAYLNAAMPGGLDAVMQHNRTLCLRARDLVCERLGVAPPVPDKMIGPMATIALPGNPDAAALKARLYDRWRIQIPVWTTPDGGTALRLSAQVYNDLPQYAYLADALAEALVDDR